jgi:nucleolar complex protein 3
VLKDLISREPEDASNVTDWKIPDSSVDTRDVQHRLLCIVTAFELLSGQGSSHWVVSIQPLNTYSFFD